MEDVENGFLLRRRNEGEQSQLDREDKRVEGRNERTLTVIFKSAVPNKDQASIREHENGGRYVCTFENDSNKPSVGIEREQSQLRRDGRKALKQKAFSPLILGFEVVVELGKDSGLCFIPERRRKKSTLSQLRRDLGETRGDAPCGLGKLIQKLVHLIDRKSRLGDVRSFLDDLV